MSSPVLWRKAGTLITESAKRSGYRSKKTGSFAGSFAGRPHGTTHNKSLSSESGIGQSGDPALKQSLGKKAKTATDHHTDRPNESVCDAKKKSDSIKGHSSDNGIDDGEAYLGNGENTAVDITGGEDKAEEDLDTRFRQAADAPGNPMLVMIEDRITFCRLAYWARSGNGANKSTKL
ncbi:hypothetical protein ACLMJK_009352 [Lecanora helva]